VPPAVYRATTQQLDTLKITQTVQHRTRQQLGYRFQQLASAKIVRVTQPNASAPNRDGNSVIPNQSRDAAESIPMQTATGSFVVVPGALDTAGLLTCQKKAGTTNAALAGVVRDRQQEDTPATQPLQPQANANLDKGKGKTMHTAIAQAWSLSRSRRPP